MRLINIQLSEEPLPDDIHGATMEIKENSYLILLNSNSPTPRKTAAFLHEMLHIYRDDYKSTESSAKLETRHHAELLEVLETLQDEKEGNNKE